MVFNFINNKNAECSTLGVRRLQIHDRDSAVGIKGNYLFAKGLEL